MSGNLPARGPPGSKTPSVITTAPKSQSSRSNTPTRLSSRLPVARSTTAALESRQSSIAPVQAEENGNSSSKNQDEFKKEMESMVKRELGKEREKRLVLETKVTQLELLLQGRNYQEHFDKSIKSQLESHWNRLNKKWSELEAKVEREVGDQLVSTLQREDYKRSLKQAVFEVLQVDFQLELPNSEGYQDQQQEIKLMQTAHRPKASIHPSHSSSSSRHPSTGSSSKVAPLVDVAQIDTEFKLIPGTTEHFRSEFITHEQYKTSYKSQQNGLQQMIQQKIDKLGGTVDGSRKRMRADETMENETTENEGGAVSVAGGGHDYSVDISKLDTRLVEITDSITSRMDDIEGTNKNSEKSVNSMRKRVSSLETSVDDRFSNIRKEVSDTHARIPVVTPLDVKAITTLVNSRLDSLSLNSTISTTLSIVQSNLKELERNQEDIEMVVETKFQALEGGLPEKIIAICQDHSVLGPLVQEKVADEVADKTSRNFWDLTVNPLVKKSLDPELTKIEKQFSQVKLKLKNLETAREETQSYLEDTTSLITKVAETLASST